MLHLRDLGVLHLDALTATGETLGTVLEWWETSERRARMKQVLLDQQGIDADGVFHHDGPARVFTSEAGAMAAIKAREVAPGDVMVIMGGGPLGTGMEETYQVTSALKHLSYGKEISLITDARFSGVSTGACLGHVGPEALAGGPIGKPRDGDLVEIRIDVAGLEGTVDYVGDADARVTPQEGARILAARAPHPDLAPHRQLPDDTRLWAALQEASGGTWNGSVYDTDRIVAVLRAGLDALDGTAS
ncbi:dihydroxy-acid dehydratase [Actinotalea sp. C106]|uniref:dihydroxy-acid dehydratase domain-containing protein n=1 Tax=Actinotalea sp. C106 TaxID=2908644 RepID=UPI00253F729C|nr:dihydroxy-acid dehydratase [Actinotalea sp. C106]